MVREFIFLNANANPHLLSKICEIKLGFKSNAVIWASICYVSSIQIPNSNLNLNFKIILKSILIFVFV